MTIEICDICGEPLSIYTDINGRTWDPIHFRDKKYRSKKWSFGGTRTECMCICGRCRAELAKRSRKEQDNETD